MRHAKSMGLLTGAIVNGHVTHPEKTPRGEGHKKAKLNEPIVRGIRKLQANGVASKDLAIRFNVHVTTIKNVLCGRTWRHVA